MTDKTGWIAAIRKLLKPAYRLPPAMSLDMRGRLVADKRVVFNSGLMHGEINAAIKLGRLLNR
jgi:hypothetical protein